MLYLYWCLPSAFRMLPSTDVKRWRPEPSLPLSSPQSQTSPQPSGNTYLDVPLAFVFQWKAGFQWKNTCWELHWSEFACQICLICPAPEYVPSKSPQKQILPWENDAAENGGSPCHLLEDQHQLKSVSIHSGSKERNLSRCQAADNSDLVWIGSSSCFKFWILMCEIVWFGMRNLWWPSSAAWIVCKYGPWQDVSCARLETERLSAVAAVDQLSAPSHWLGECHNDGNSWQLMENPPWKWRTKNVPFTTCSSRAPNVDAEHVARGAALTNSSSDVELTSLRTFPHLPSPSPKPTPGLPSCHMAA